MLKVCILIILVSVGSSCVYAQASASRGRTAKATVHQEATAESLALQETSFDFGSIPQGRPVTHDFEIKNTGKTPLILENVEASCGCTTPQWSQSPISPGSSSVIKVGFNAGSQGQFAKNITITYNGSQVKTLTISGNVYESPATSAPLNTSLSILK